MMNSPMKQIMKNSIQDSSLIYQMYNPIIKETIYYSYLSNGLPVYILPKKGFAQKYAIFSTNYGSIDSTFRVPGEKETRTVPDGIAHFLEHKMFENNESNVFDLFAAYGANVNAFTTYTMTSYLFDTIENFPECLELLLDFVQTLFLTEESVEKEKGIIEQEIRMYEDDPDWITYLNLMQVLFHNHSVRTDIAGTIESVYQINLELLLTCHKTFYHPNNMVLFIEGDLDPETVINQVRINQSNKDFDLQPPVEKIISKEPKHVKAHRVEARMPLSRPIYYLGFKEQETGVTGDQLLKKDLITGIVLELLIGKGAPLYQTLYESSLIDDSFSVSITLEQDHGMTVLGGHTSDPDQLHQALYEGIISRVDKITEEEFERVRKRMIGDYIVTFDSLKSTAQNFVSYYLKGINLFNEIQILEEITLKDINDRLREHFDYQNHAISIMYPEEK